MKGMILAGGLGTRLYPLTYSVSKHLLPIYNKPMIYYPLTTLMLAGIRQILVITSPDAQAYYQTLLRDGSQWGLIIDYAIQSQPRGISDAFLLEEFFIDQEPVALILGGNLFYEEGLVRILTKATESIQGGSIFAYYVQAPEHYCVVELSNSGDIISLEEKPTQPKSPYVVPGLYFYDPQVVDIDKTLQTSQRGELEITDINQIYLQEKKLNIEVLGRGITWLDAGTHESLLEASNFVATIEKRQELKIACPEEIAYRKRLINTTQLLNLAEPLLKTEYGQYLLTLTHRQYLSL
jgi:glucose-1-phosphate thymidylyltransferase